MLITLAFVHMIQLIMIPVLIWLFKPSFKPFAQFSKYEMTVGFVGFYLLYYFLVYNRIKWREYLSEFENEDQRIRSKGTVLVKLFTIGSVVVFFILLFMIAVR